MAKHSIMYTQSSNLVLEWCEEGNDNTNPMTIWP